MPDLPESGSTERWTPAAKEKALAAIEERTESPRYPFFCPDRECSGEPHGSWKWEHARSDQRPPLGFGHVYRYWLISSGRGSGKTRTGSELTHQMTKSVPRIALVAPTAADARDVMVEGISGLKATASPDNYPLYEPSKRLITWDNGCQATIFSGEEPDRIRGRGVGFTWIDEGAHIPLINEVWTQLRMIMRLPGQPTRTLITTTPTASDWIKKLVTNPRTYVTRVSTWANRRNLAESLLDDLQDLVGTRIGRQELDGEILDDIEGALWRLSMIQYLVDTPFKGSSDTAPIDFEDMDRVVVGVDPQGTDTKRSDATGIVVAGRMDRNLFAFADYTIHGGPDAWASEAIRAYQAYNADAIAAEKNYGGDMVSQVIHDRAPNIRVIPVSSRRGKDIRAEPIVSIYEQGRAIHVKPLPELETEMTTWVPGSRMRSPNRIDALVHAATELFPERTADALISSPLIVARSFDPVQALLRGFAIPGGMR